MFSEIQWLSGSTDAPSKLAIWRHDAEACYHRPLGFWPVIWQGGILGQPQISWGPQYPHQNAEGLNRREVVKLVLDLPLHSWYNMGD